MARELSAVSCRVGGSHRLVLCSQRAGVLRDVNRIVSDEQANIVGQGLATDTRLATCCSTSMTLHRAIR